MIINKKYDEIITQFYPLEEWFLNNSSKLIAYGFTHKNCCHYERTFVSDDIKVLGRMAHACYVWLDSNTNEYTAFEIAYNATMAMEKVYEEEEYKLSDYAKEQYYISNCEMEKNCLSLELK